ncbi:hypothetical protein FRACA_10123 [Frankia canadensis]|uniref:Uncharacterized protein n=1 Tax=Frankia canadensis TaxID=1836972 RepID=A0A2I2KI76_9ACTN|nr:hypothetical protein FRACA_10123 [Frankia canadensis]SOU52654.1 hypothetical protein FRACA_10123 [Frankia canadensis]
MDDGQLVRRGQSRGERAERAIRVTTVVAVALVAAFVSYQHMRGVAVQHGGIRRPRRCCRSAWTG